MRGRAIGGGRIVQSGFGVVDVLVFGSIDRHFRRCLRRARLDGRSGEGALLDLYTPARGGVGTIFELCARERCYGATPFQATGESATYLSASEEKG